MFPGRQPWDRYSEKSSNRVPDRALPQNSALLDMLPPTLPAPRAHRSHNAPLQGIPTLGSLTLMCHSKHTDMGRMHSMHLHPSLHQSTETASCPTHSTPEVLRGTNGTANQSTTLSPAPSQKNPPCPGWQKQALLSCHAHSFFLKFRELERRENNGTHSFSP